MIAGTKRINLYFKKEPQAHKWIPGDRQFFNFIRSLTQSNRVGSIEKVFINLCKGLDKLNLPYSKNISFAEIKPHEPVIVLGQGKHCLKGYNRPNTIIAGIGLMTHPSEWPDLFNEYPVGKYLQHSDWTNNIYIPYYGAARCATWPAGVDTDYWKPGNPDKQNTDILIYNKIMWNKDEVNQSLRLPIIAKLQELGLSYKEITYGHYKEKQYAALLQQCKAMIFLCEHESQGLACGEALAMNVPVFAWNQGFWLDPHWLKESGQATPANSVPFFDHRCGMQFKDITEFNNNITAFLEKANNKEFTPRTYVLENISIEKSTQRMLDIIAEVYK